MRVGGAQDRVGVLEGDGQGLLAERGEARGERAQRDLSVRVIGAEHHDRVEVEGQELVEGSVAGALGVDLLGHLSAGPLGGIDDGHDACALPRPVGVEGDGAAQPEADHSDPEVFHAPQASERSWACEGRARIRWARMRAGGC